MIQIWYLPSGLVKEPGACSVDQRLRAGGRGRGDRGNRVPTVQVTRLSDERGMFAELCLPNVGTVIEKLNN
jgi:hypothetical protein